MNSYFCKKEVRSFGLLHIMKLSKIEEEISDEVLDDVSFERTHHRLMICKVLYEAGHLEPDHVSKIDENDKLIEVLFAVKMLSKLFKKEKPPVVFSEILPMILIAKAPRAMAFIIPELKQEGRLDTPAQAVRYLEPLTQIDTLELMTKKIQLMVQEEHQLAFFEGNFAMVALKGRAIPGIPPSISARMNRRKRRPSMSDLSAIKEEAPSISIGYKY